MNKPIHPPLFITQNNSYDKLYDTLIIKLSGFPTKNLIKPYELCLVSMIHVEITVIFGGMENLLNKFYYSKWCRVMDNMKSHNTQIENNDVILIGNKIIYQQLLPSYMIDSLSYLGDIKVLQYRIDIQIHFSTPEQLFICLNNEMINIDDMKLEVDLMKFDGDDNYMFEIEI